MNKKRRHIENIPVNKIRTDQYGDELMGEPEMRPYLGLIAAEMNGDLKAVEKFAREVQELPVELKYTARIIRALRWGFADFDSAGIQIDLRCGFTESDIARLDQNHEERALQFCLFLKVLYGQDRMKQIMVQAIKSAID